MEVPGSKKGVLALRSVFGPRMRRVIDARIRNFTEWDAFVWAERVLTGTSFGGLYSYWDLPRAMRGKQSTQHKFLHIALICEYLMSQYDESCSMNPH